MYNFKCIHIYAWGYKLVIIIIIIIIIIIDDAWKITSEIHGKHAIQRHLHNTKREDLTGSTSVVPAKYPPNVKLELLTTLEC